MPRYNSKLFYVQRTLKNETESHGKMWSIDAIPEMLELSDRKFK